VNNELNSFADNGMNPGDWVIINNPDLNEYAQWYFGGGYWQLGDTGYGAGGGGWCGNQFGTCPSVQ